MSTKKIIVTGGAGFIGSHLVDALLRDGHEVTAIDNLANGQMRNISEALQNKNFTFHEADILNLEVMKKITEGSDIIYHLACLGVRHSLHSPIENHKVNAEGTLNMLEAARANKTKKFIYISSSEVYGEAKTFPLDENSMTYPTTVYGSSKLVGENYTMSYRHFGLDVTVTRIFNNYGPRAHYEGDSGEVIPRSIVYLLNDKAPVVFGDGLITRDFFYVKDTARALADLINRNDLDGELLNIGTGEEITMKALLENLISVFGKSHIKLQHFPARPADVPRLWVNAAKFHNKTGFIAAYDFNRGLQETIDYYVELNKHENLIEKVKTINWEK